MKENYISIPGFSFISLSKLHIKKVVNDHIWVSISATFSQEVAASILSKGVSKKAFQIIASDDKKNKKIIFNGVVHWITQRQENEAIVLDITAVSRTILLDQDKNFRVFQDANRTYKSIASIVANQAGTGIIVSEASKTSPQLFVQYEETDWEFLLRTASCANSFIVSDYILDDAFISLGMPKKSTKASFEDYEYSVGKNLMDYYRKAKYQKKDIHENDFLYYTVTSREIFDLCSEVVFMNRRLYIFEIITDFIGGELMHKYTLKTKEGFKKTVKDNLNLQGACFAAKVFKVQKDKVQVQFDGDKQADESKYWFTLTTPYSAKGASGWYFMPCEMDSVMIHFPSFDGSGVYATVAQTYSIGCDNPQTQILQSQHGHAIEFSEKQIKIKSVSGSNIIISDTDGIKINSLKDLAIDAGANLTLTAGSGINITSDNGIRLNKSSSTITIGDEILIKGDRIKLKQ